MIRILTLSRRYRTRRKTNRLHFESATHHPLLPWDNGKGNPRSITSKSVAPPSYAFILQELKELEHLQQVHARIVTSGLADNIFLSNILMNSYAFFGLMVVAEQIFRQIPRKNVFSWTILISGFTRNEFYSEAFDVFSKMKLSGFLPNEVTISTILPAFVYLELISIGRATHCFWVRSGFGHNVFVETSLIDMYAKFGRMGSARTLFDSMPERNTVSWNAIISGYSDNGFYEEAIRHFILMQRNGFVVDFITIISLTSASFGIGRLDMNSAIHSYTIRSGFENDELVKTALMDMYVKCSSIEDAYSIFNEMPVKDVVAWTLMLSSFSEMGYGNKAVELFNEMMRTGEVALDSVALMGTLSSCSHLGALQQGKKFHALTIKTGFGDNIFLGSALIDMYSNCGNLKSAKKFFKGMKNKDVVCWNAMIAGTGLNGYGDDAIDLFLKMKGSGINPDDSTLVCVLCACSHAGMVDQGLHIFQSMVNDWHMVPNLQHYACMVDLLGRAGRLDDAHSLLHSMPLQPDPSVYGSLLGACRVHGNFDLGLEVSEKLFELEIDDAGYYALLSNMYAVSKNWEGVKQTRILLRSKGLKKSPGFSSIEIDQEVHTFMAGEQDHPQFSEIDWVLNGLINKIEAVV